MSVASAARSVAAATTDTTRSASRLSYHVLRTQNGTLPVYSDVRNGGTRYLVQIRNVQGNPHALIRDLKNSLFPPHSREASLLTAKLSTGSKHVILQAPARGWRNIVADWLVQRGF